MNIYTQLLEADNRLNKADIWELFFLLGFSTPHFLRTAVPLYQPAVMAPLIRSSKHKAAGVRTQSYLLHKGSHEG